MDFGKIGPTFSIFSAMPAKITPKIFWFVLRDEICLISSSQLYGSILCMVLKALSSDFNKELTYNSTNLA